MEKGFGNDAGPRAVDVRRELAWCDARYVLQV